MQIILNGETKVVSSPLTVSQLIEQLGLGGRRVAVEVNREIVPRSRHADLELRHDDRVEVVRAIGGG
jgi:sulfur carrier protein